MMLVMLIMLQWLSVSKALYLEDVLQNEAAHQYLSQSEFDPSYVPSMTTASLAPDSDDTRILLDLYFSTQGQSWDPACRWNISAAATSWYGVQFDTTTMKVTGVNLAYCYLVGTIPSSIGNLTSMANLDFGYNYLYSTVPASIGNLVNLEALSIFDNSFSGTIPLSIGNLVNLKMLNLFDNYLTGTVPSSIGQFQYLKYLYISYNYLHGNIFPSLVQLTLLYDLYIYSNYFSGTIPSTIDQLQSLSDFAASQNQISGSIPSTISNIVSLKYFYFSNNLLTGTIPPILGNWQNLLYFYINGNRLSGSIPSTIGAWESLEVFLANNNKLTGTIPPSIGNLVKLEIWSMYSNLLSGSIPPSISQLLPLRYFDLSINRLTGSIPSSIGNIVSLTEINLQSNLLTGIIPTSLGALPALKILNLRSNRLSGSMLPFNEASTLTNLIVSFNNLEGQIPSGLCFIKNIRELKMAGNKFSCFEGCLEIANEGFYDYMIHPYYPVCGNQQQAICGLDNAQNVGMALKDPFSIPAIKQSFPAWKTFQPMVNTFTFYEFAIAEYEVSFGRDLSGIFGSHTEGVRVVANCTLCNSHSCSNYFHNIYESAKFPGIHGIKPFVSTDKYLKITCIRTRQDPGGDLYQNESLILPGFFVTITRRLKYTSWDCSNNASSVAVNPCNWQGKNFLIVVCMKQ